MAVEEPVAIVAINVGNARRHVVHNQPQFDLRRAQCVLRLLESVNIVHQHERAMNFPRCRRVGHDADRHPAPDAIRPRHQPIERRRLAVQRAGQHLLRTFVDCRPEDIAQTHRRHLLDCYPEILQERAVDVTAALVMVEIGNGRRHTVHDRSELRLTLRQRLLSLFQVRDVMTDNVKALDRPIEFQVGYDAAV